MTKKCPNITYRQAKREAEGGETEAQPQPRASSKDRAVSPSDQKRPKRAGGPAFLNRRSSHQTDTSYRRLSVAVNVSGSVADAMVEEDMGRIGPGGVLGVYVATAADFSKQVRI